MNARFSSEFDDLHSALHINGVVTCSLVYFRWQDICEIYVSGGNLDHMSDLDILRERGGAELRIVLLNSTGKVRCQGQRRQKFRQSKKPFSKFRQVDLVFFGTIVCYMLVLI